MHFSAGPSNSRLVVGALFSSLLIALAATVMAGSQGGGVAGGWTPQSVDDEGIKDIAGKAMKEVNAQSNANDYLLHVRILSAKSQVVSGINYELELLVAPSTCQKNQVASDGSNSGCLQEKDGGKREVYTVQVWKQPWLNSTKVTIKEVKAATGADATKN